MNLPRHPKEAENRAVAANLARTAVQVAGMWSLFLLFIPVAIAWGVRLAGFSAYDFQPGPWKWVALGVFLVAGGIGIYGGILFAIRGNVTPWPLDCTTRFLVIGPYRHIRNPMAACGIIQGLCVGLFLGSPFVIAYALAGAPAWHYLARPWEEEDLLRRFGADYERYRRSVPLWIPTWNAYPRTEVDHGPMLKTVTEPLGPDASK